MVQTNSASVVSSRDTKKYERSLLKLSAPTDILMNELLEQHKSFQVKQEKSQAFELYVQYSSRDAQNALLQKYPFCILIVCVTFSNGSADMQIHCRISLPQSIEGVMLWETLSAKHDFVQGLKVGKQQGAKANGQVPI